RNSQTVVSVISAQDIQTKQQNVQVWYDNTKVTPQQLLDIQLLKAGKHITLPQGMDFATYSHELESLASYVVVRGEVTQHFEMDKNATTITISNHAPNERKRVLYYANFPKFQGHSGKDLLDFAED